MKIDLPDLFVLIGIVLMGAALFFSIGWVGLLGFVGIACMIAGLFLGHQKAAGGGPR